MALIIKGKEEFSVTVVYENGGTVSEHYKSFDEALAMCKRVKSFMSQNVKTFIAHETQYEVQ